MSARAALWVKVCGITREEDARAAVEAGASALGLNFVPRSKRRIDVPSARRIADAVRGQAEIVGVVEDLSRAELELLTRDVGLDWLQLHGSEPSELLQSLPGAFKALGVASAHDVELGRAFPGSRLLLDAKQGSSSGGTGVVFDWSLVQALARERPIILAGGLTPLNVASAVHSVRPWGVDVAGGVESDGDPRRKDREKLDAFVANARRAHAELP
ncbi:MAG: phosphoribosylanthranilate isomerase [Polyangiaceae bacterium]